MDPFSLKSTLRALAASKRQEPSSYQPQEEPRDPVQKLGSRIQKDIVKEAPPGLLERAGGTALSGLATVGNLLDVPGSMVRDVATWLPGGPAPANPLDQIASPFTHHNRTTGRDLMRGYGLAGKEDTMGNFTTGLGAEIALDPLTYLTFGASALTRGGRAAKALNLMDDAPEIASRLMNRRVGKREARHVVTPRMLLSNPKIGDEARQRLQQRMTEMGVTEKDLDRQLGGLAKINMPFSNKPFTWHKKPITFGGLTDEDGIIGAGRIRGRGPEPLSPLPDMDVPPPGDIGPAGGSAIGGDGPDIPPTRGPAPDITDMPDSPVTPEVPPLAGPAAGAPAIDPTPVVPSATINAISDIQQIDPNNFGVQASIPESKSRARATLTYASESDETPMLFIDQFEKQPGSPKGSGRALINSMVEKVKDRNPMGVAGNFDTHDQLGAFASIFGKDKIRFLDRATGQPVDISFAEVNKTPDTISKYTAVHYFIEPPKAAAKVEVPQYKPEEIEASRQLGYEIDQIPRSYNEMAADIKSTPVRLLAAESAANNLVDMVSQEGTPLLEALDKLEWHVDVGFDGLGLGKPSPAEIEHARRGMQLVERPLNINDLIEYGKARVADARKGEAQAEAERIFKKYGSFDMDEGAYYRAVLGEAPKPKQQKALIDDATVEPSLPEHEVLMRTDPALYQKWKNGEVEELSRYTGKPEHDSIYFRWTDAGLEHPWPSLVKGDEKVWDQFRYAPQNIAPDKSWDNVARTQPATEVPPSALQPDLMATEVVKEAKKRGRKPKNVPEGQKVAEAEDKAKSAQFIAEQNQQRMLEQKKQEQQGRINNWKRAYQSQPKEYLAASDLGRKDYEKALTAISPMRLMEMVDDGVVRGAFTAQEAADLKLPIASAARADVLKKFVDSIDPSKTPAQTERIAIESYSSLADEEKGLFGGSRDFGVQVSRSAGEARRNRVPASATQPDLVTPQVVQEAKKSGRKPKPVVKAEAPVATPAPTKPMTSMEAMQAEAGIKPATPPSDIARKTQALIKEVANKRGAGDAEVAEMLLRGDTASAIRRLETKPLDGLKLEGLMSAAKKNGIMTAEQADAVLAAIPPKFKGGMSVLDEAKQVSNDLASKSRLESRIDQTETPEFKNWFKASKAVDETGKPLELYHGSLADFKEFRPADTSSYYGRGVYLTASPEDASKYASNDVSVNLDYGPKAEKLAGELGISYKEAKEVMEGTGGNVYKVYASLQNPLILENKPIRFDESAMRLALAESDVAVKDVTKLVKELNAAKTAKLQHDILARNRATQSLASYASLKNHDGLIVGGEMAPRSGGSKHVIAFRSEQVKSATGNRGTFDPVSRSILESQQQRVGIRVDTETEGLGKQAELLAAKGFTKEEIDVIDAAYRNMVSDADYSSDLSGTITLATVPKDRLIQTQEWRNKPAIKGSKHPLLAIEQDGELYLKDGHHRLDGVDGDVPVVYYRSAGDFENEGFIQVVRENQSRLEAQGGTPGAVGQAPTKVDLNTLEGLPDQARPIVGDMINKIGQKLFDDVTMEVGGDAAKAVTTGDIDMDTGFIRIYNSAIQSGIVDKTTVHELWHHLSKFITAEEVRIVQKEFDDAVKANKGPLPYELSSIDEYFAHKLTDLSMKYLGKEKPASLIGKTWAKALDVFEYLWDAIRQTLGYDKTKQILNSFLDGHRAGAVKLTDATMQQRLAGDVEINGNILDSQADPIIPNSDIAGQLAQAKSAILGKSLDDIGESILDSAVGRQMTALFDQSVLGQITKAGQEAARLAFKGYRDAVFKERAYMAQHLRTWYDLPNIREDIIMDEELAPLAEYITNAGGDKALGAKNRMIEARKIQNDRVNGLRRLLEQPLWDEQGNWIQDAYRVEESELPAWVGQEKANGQIINNPTRRQQVAEMLTAWRLKTVQMLGGERNEGILLSLVNGYFPRLVSNLPGSNRSLWNPNYGKILDPTHPSAKRRKDWFVGYDDGTSVINDISIDAELSGAHSKKMVREQPSPAEIQQYANVLWERYKDRLMGGRAQLTYGELAQADPKAFAKINKLTEEVMNLDPRHVEHQIPLFSNDLFSAMELRLEHHHRSIMHAKAIQHLVKKHAVARNLIGGDGQGVTLNQLLKESKYDSNVSRDILEVGTRGDAALAADKSFWNQEIQPRINEVMRHYQAERAYYLRNPDAQPGVATGVTPYTDPGGRAFQVLPYQGDGVRRFIFPQFFDKKVPGVPSHQMKLEVNLDDPSETMVTWFDQLDDGQNFIGESLAKILDNPTDKTSGAGYVSGTPTYVLFEHITVPKDVGDAITKFVQGPRTLEEVRPLVRGYDKGTNMWKMMQTGMLPFIGFHGRNFGSGQASNFYLGVQNDPRFKFNLANPTTYLNPIRSFVQPIVDAHKIATGQTIEGAASMPQFAGMNLTDEAATEALRRESYAQAITGEKQGISAEQLTDTVGTAASQFPGIDASKSINPLAWQWSKPVPESTFAQRWLMPWMSKGVMSDADIFRPGQLGRDLGSYTESLNRLAPYIAMRRQGFDPKAAAREVNRAQVDYTNLSNFNREYTRRLFPFASYTLGMTPTVFGELASRPGGGMGRTVMATTAAGQSSEQGVTPDYIRETASIPLGMSEDGTRSYITGFGLPFEDPLQFAQLARGNVSGVLRELGSRMNPVPKSLIEIMTGRSLYQAGPFGGREIEDLDPTIGRIVANINDLATGEKTEKAEPFLGNPWAEYIIANAGPGRMLNTVRTITDPRKWDTVPWKLALNLGTGVRVADVSPSAQDAILRERLARVMKDFGGRMYTRPYFPDYAKEDWTPQEAEDAAKIDALLKLLGQRAKERRVP